MIIPCKDCLILPICRLKKEIRCNLIYDWYHADHHSSWSFQEIGKHLSVWKRIIREDGKGGILNDRRWSAHHLIEKKGIQI